MADSTLRILIHKFILRPLLKLLFAVDVRGRTNLSGLNSYIIAANHNSHLDALLLYYIIPEQDLARTHIVAAEDYFSRRPLLFRISNYLFRPIWINRESKAPDPLQAMRTRLEEGHNIIIFPEGTRGEAGHICHFHSGVGRVAELFQKIPVVPVFLFGTERAFPKSSHLPLPVCSSVTIGPPQQFIGSATDFSGSLEAFIRRMAATETTLRQSRPVSPSPPGLIAVMGIDGSGKSTLSHNLSQQLSAEGEVCLVSDRLEFYVQGKEKNIRPLLSESIREAISRYAKQAKSLKSYKLPKLAEMLLRDHLIGEAGRWYKPELIIQDGSPLLNLVGWSILYREDAFNREACVKAIKLLSGQINIASDDPVLKEFPELSLLQQLRPRGMALPEILIMLDIDPEICCRRIKSRGEPVQPHETKDKLSRMRNGYLKVCEVADSELNIPVLILKGNQDMAEVCRLAVKFIQHQRGE